MKRRQFIHKNLFAAGGVMGLSQFPGLLQEAWASDLKSEFKVSIAPWSLTRKPYGENDPDGIHFLDYPLVARELGFEAIEHDNLHYPGDLPNDKHLAKMKQRTEEAGVTNTLILCGALGDIADSRKSRRKKANFNYERWIEAAQFLGCHQVRVVCSDHIDIDWDEKMKLTVEAVSKLADFAQGHSIELLIENHNGYTSNPNWLVEMIQKVNRPNCGILGDFTEWRIEQNPDVLYPDPYKGYEILAPYVKSVGAKSTTFDVLGNELVTDYPRMFEILNKVGYQGYIAVEYFGNDLPRRKGTTMTKELVERIIAKY